MDELASVGDLPVELEPIAANPVEDMGVELEALLPEDFPLELEPNILPPFLSLAGLLLELLPIKPAPDFPVGPDPGFFVTGARLTS